jgi:hypothetical protein
MKKLPVIYSLIATVISPIIVMILGEFYLTGKVEFNNDMFALSSFTLVVLLPILIISQLLSIKKRIAGLLFYVMCNVIILVFALYTLTLELHGPLFGYIFGPSIIINIPFGVWSIFSVGSIKLNV